MRIANYIEGKVEEFRLAGKKPASLGLTAEIMQGLCEELRPKERNKMNVLIDGKKIEGYPILTKFINLDVFTEAGPHMPEDGVLIHEVRG